MTFIASVIAKKGVAIVADSFVTSIDLTLDIDTFINHLSKAKNKKSIPSIQVLKLFERKTSHTRNYVDKLIQFDGYSAITTTGMAFLNGKEITTVIKDISSSMQSDKNAYEAKSVEEIIQEFCDLIKEEVHLHTENSDVSETDFIFSHFNRTKREPQVFVIKIKGCEKLKFDPKDKELVTYLDRTFLGIITDGQDKFVDRLIFGSLYKRFYSLKKEFLSNIFKIIRPKKAKKEAVTKAIMDADFMKTQMLDDLWSIKFRELSLQEAVELATLLIKIEMDIQVYTENIPTVGGLIRLATISEEEGFKWISGNDISKPKIIL